MRVPTAGDGEAKELQNQVEGLGTRPENRLDEAAGRGLLVLIRDRQARDGLENLSAAVSGNRISHRES